MSRVEKHGTGIIAPINAKEISREIIGGILLLFVYPAAATLVVGWLVDWGMK